MGWDKMNVEGEGERGCKQYGTKVKKKTDIQNKCTSQYLKLDPHL